MSQIERIFSYGTLQDEKVQLANFGRKLIGKSDTLTGYKLSQLKITNPETIAISGLATHLVLVATGNSQDMVPGTVFDITPQELQRADEYEAADYERAAVILASGSSAWVYLGKSVCLAE